MYLYRLECSEYQEEAQRYTILLHEDTFTRDQLTAMFAEASAKVIIHNVEKFIAAKDVRGLRTCSYSTEIWDDVIAVLVKEHGFQDAKYETTLWVDECYLMRDNEKFNGACNRDLRIAIRNSIQQEVSDKAAEYERLWRNR